MAVFAAAPVTDGNAYLILVIAVTVLRAAKPRRIAKGHDTGDAVDGKKISIGTAGNAITQTVSIGIARLHPGDMSGALLHTHLRITFATVADDLREQVREAQRVQKRALLQIAGSEVFGTVVITRNITRKWIAAGRGKDHPPDRSLWSKARAVVDAADQRAPLSAKRQPIERISQ